MTSPQSSYSFRATWSGAFVWDSSPKSIDRQGLGEIGQPRSQGLCSLPPLVVGSFNDQGGQRRETLGSRLELGKYIGKYWLVGFGFRVLLHRCIQTEPFAATRTIDVNNCNQNIASEIWLRFPRLIHLHECLSDTKSCS